MKPTIALCIMCRNEEKALPRLLASVEGCVEKIIALDTGSSDSTLAILQAARVEVKQSSFKDFGQSRTELMEFAWGKADWLLLMDADQELVCGIDMPELWKVLDSDVDCYSLENEGNFGYWVPRIVKGNMQWKFKGATHEYLERSESAVKLPGVKIRHHDDGGCKADKFTRDHALLAAEFRRDPTNSRALFYLANTKRDMNLRNSARQLYLKRAEMGGWEEERWYAQFEAARVSLDPLELWECWAIRQTRAEPLAILADVYAGRGWMAIASEVNAAREKIPLPDEVLFVDKSAYGVRPMTLFPPWCAIPGWFDYEDVYQKIVELMPEHGGMFAEIGVWHCRSSAAFDYFAKKAGKDICLTAVDTFDGTPTAPTQICDEYVGGYRYEFDENMKRCGVTHLEVHSQPSVITARWFHDATFDAVFIDADHSYEAVCADILAWGPKVKVTGLLAGHDYDRPDVKRAVLSHFNEADVKVSGRTWIASAFSRLIWQNFS